MDLRSLPANDLARLCSDSGNIEAWYEFVRRFEPPISSTVLNVARQWRSASVEVVEEIVQDVMLRLCADQCKLLRNFVPYDQDGIVAYLRVIARHAALDHFRETTTQKRGGLVHRYETEDGDLDFLPDLSDRMHPAEWAIRMQEIDGALQSMMPHPITDRDRSIFWLYYNQGFTAREVALAPNVGLTVKGVEASIHRTSKLLREFFARPRPIAAISKGFSANPAIHKENG